MNQDEKIGLFSASNKEGMEEFAEGLVRMDWRILSTGRTHDALVKARIPTIDVEKITGMPSILGDRVKTLHPSIHAGLLATTTMLEELKQHGFPWIDLLYVNFYPLEREIQRIGSTPESILEQTDIGGPTMCCSGAKGRRIVLCDPRDRQWILDWLRAGSPDNELIRLTLAGKAELTVAAYREASGEHIIELAEETPTTSDIGAALKKHLLGSLPVQLALAHDALESASD